MGRKYFNFSVIFGTAFERVGYGQRSGAAFRKLPWNQPPKFVRRQNKAAPKTRFISVADYTNCLRLTK
jgi:hypothetical protein